MLNCPESQGRISFSRLSLLFPGTKEQLNPYRLTVRFEFSVYFRPSLDYYSVGLLSSRLKESLLDFNYTINCVKLLANLLFLSTPTGTVVLVSINQEQVWTIVCSLFRWVIAYKLPSKLVSPPKFNSPTF